MGGGYGHLVIVGQAFSIAFYHHIFVFRVSLFFRAPGRGFLLICVSLQTFSLTLTQPRICVAFTAEIPLLSFCPLALAKFYLKAGRRVGKKKKRNKQKRRTDWHSCYIIVLFFLSRNFYGEPACVAFWHHQVAG
ncbi:hypothetical protein GGR52DRAFT_545248 [Hypoxylon sp. FL1284]|nr:hypothetical protein GGR52DRAFT_545248 [Hypoxylon sp. FL1284]